MSFSLTWPVFKPDMSFLTTINSSPPILSISSLRDSAIILLILFLETAFLAILLPTAIPTFKGEPPFSKKISNSVLSSFFAFAPLARIFVKRALGARFLAGSIKPWAFFFPWLFFFLWLRAHLTFASFFGNRGFLPFFFFWADMFFLACFSSLADLVISASSLAESDISEEQHWNKVSSWPADMGSLDVNPTHHSQLNCYKGYRKNYTISSRGKQVIHKTFLGIDICWKVLQL